MFGTLHWLWPDEFPSYWRWVEENFDVVDQQVSRTKVVKQIRGLRGGVGEEDFFASLGPRILRRTLPEVSPAHRGKLSYHEIVCDMEPLQLRQYQELSRDAAVTTKNGIVIANGIMAEMTRARQVANGAIDSEGEDNHVIFRKESGKIEMLMHQLDRRGLIGKSNPRRRKVVIASRFNEFLDQVCRRLKANRTKFHYLTGATTDRQRERIMEEFQGLGGPNILVMNAQTGGVSVTLDAADEMHQLDEMYPPEANEQLHKRIFRRSRVHRTRIYYYRSEGTIDTTIAGTIGKKLATQLKVLDGRRGLSVVREVIRYQPPREVEPR
jgi:SNF2 family DNA or RNA helicase